jgi:hypothetical protein
MLLSIYECGAAETQAVGPSPKNVVASEYGTPVK